MVRVQKDIIKIQVINNLISNAIKLSKEYSKIHISLIQQAESIELIVEDQGIGMSENYLASLFEESGANSRRGTAGEHGTGFGMPILKKFMDLYGGHIKVSSRCISVHPDNHGTKVVLTFTQAN
jgi:signal transduction histidine kinase